MSSQLPFFFPFCLQACLLSPKPCDVNGFCAVGVVVQEAKSEEFCLREDVGGAC